MTRTVDWLRLTVLLFLIGETTSSKHILQTPMGSTTHIVQQPMGSTHLAQPMGSAHMVQPMGSSHMVQKPMGSTTHIVQQPMRSTHLVQPMGSAHIVQPIGSSHMVQKPMGSTTHIVQQPMGSTHIVQRPIGATHIVQRPIGTANIMQQPIVPIGYPIGNIGKNQHYNMLLSLQHQIRMQFVHFLVQLESTNLRIFNISPELLNFFRRNPDLRNLIEMFYYSFFNSPAPRHKIEIIQKFIFYILKLKQGTERIYDLTPDILSLILKLKYWPEFLPPLLAGTSPQIITSFIKFINDAASLELDSQTVPQNLSQYRSQIIPENILGQLKSFILEITNNKKLNYISPSLLEFFIRNHNLKNQIEIILQNGNIPSSKLNTQIIVQLIDLIKRIKNKEAITNITIPLLEIVLGLQGAEELVAPMLTWVQDNKAEDMMRIFNDIINKNDGEIPQNLRNWILTLPTGKLMIDYLELPGDIKCIQKPDEIVECTKLSVQTGDAESDNINYNVNNNSNG